MAVERKSATDFITSVIEGRLFDQMARMLIEHDRAIVLVEGSLYDTRSAIGPEAIDGALSYISLLSGASLMVSPSLARTPYLLHRMALHLQHGLGYTVPLRAGKAKAPRSANTCLKAYRASGRRLRSRFWLTSVTLERFFCVARSSSASQRRWPQKC